ncbi:hypothetical protein ETAR_12930 [Edwardsiella tarda]
MNIQLEGDGATIDEDFVVSAPVGDSELMLGYGTTRIIKCDDVSSHSGTRCRGDYSIKKAGMTKW